MATGISTGKWSGEQVIPFAEALGAIELNYSGKQSVAEVLGAKAAHLEIIENINNSNGDNRIYLGDNLPILAALMGDESVRGKVDLCYIDPPYATQSVFHSRSEKAAYMDLLKGPEYIEFLRKRLILIRELMSDHGSIYIHLDDNMAFYAKILCDEVFGKKNFRNWITRKKCNTKNYTKHQFGNVADYILFYTKTDEYVWNRPKVDWSDETMRKEYSYIEPDGRRFKKVPIHAPGVRNGETGKPWRGVMPPTGKHWQYVPSKLEELDKKGEIFWSKNGNPRRKIYFDPASGIPVQDIWMDFKDAHNQNIKITGYPTEKNFDMLKFIVGASTDQDSLVLDCFMGSGTTLEAADFLNRRWIGIDSSQEALDVTKKRLIYGRERMGDFVQNKSMQMEIGIDTKTATSFRILKAV